MWAQIWAGLMHMAAAAAGWCAAIKYVTNFSCHTFGLLIATIYAVTGATGIARYYTRSQSFAACLMETILALGTTLVSLYLANATNWTLFNAKVRTVVSDYAPTFAIVLMTIISLIGRADDLGEDLTRLDVPRTFGTTHGRTWFLNPFELEGWAIALALVPGTIILILFIFDHNVSSIMAQSKEFNLKKGSAYHLDFFVLGICIVCTGILGIPPCNGLIPQAPLHTKSLCVVSKVKRGSKTVDVVDRTYEQRYTNLAQAAMTGIPNATLDGLFLFMALSSLPGNELWDRVKLVVCEKRLRESPKDWYAALDFSTIASFTRLQFSVAFLIFFVTLTPIAMTFPLFIAALVYIRTKILPKYYGAAAEMRAIEGEARALERARGGRDRGARAATPPFDGDDDAKAKHDCARAQAQHPGSGDDAA
ncbi:inorganic anion exchanger [Aureococcus anophagefferens]|nr:inorganic anion exchanger [Aureococcus anophagefferens]